MPAVSKGRIVEELAKASVVGRIKSPKAPRRRSVQTYERVKGIEYKRGHIELTQTKMKREHTQIEIVTSNYGNKRTCHRKPLQPLSWRPGVRGIDNNASHS